MMSAYDVEKIRNRLPDQDASQVVQGLDFKCICISTVDRINRSAPGRLQSAADLQRVVV